MAHALGVSRSDMLLKHGTDVEPQAFAGLIDRRSGHEPVAYIIGKQEFYGREFAVTPDVLIPRGDSETLIEAALEFAPYAKRVLDLGTGSGCLLLTVLAELPQAEGVGIDASSAAVKVASDNAARLDVAGRARMCHTSWSEEGWAKDLGQFDLILANPPYVEEAANLDPSVRAFEPAQALFAGADGLEDYKTIIPQLRGLMSADGIAILEIGSAQAESVSEIARQHGFATQLRRDLADRPRALILT